MLHDAVLMWALGVNKTINDFGVAHLDNGTAITSNLLGYTFQGTRYYWLIWHKCQKACKS